LNISQHNWRSFQVACCLPSVSSLSTTLSLWKDNQVKVEEHRLFVLGIGVGGWDIVLNKKLANSHILNRKVFVTIPDVSVETSVKKERVE
jgi:hypothetical protein